MIEVRAAKNNDFSAWTEMRTKLWPSLSTEGHLAELKESVSLNTFKAWIAFKDNLPVGFAEASLRPFANGCEGRPVVFLEGAWVRENARQRGVGRQLMTAVEKWAISLGLTEIGSDADINNEISHQSHIGWGFQETERVVYFRKKLAKP